jgi:hypothetical protein
MPGNWSRRRATLPVSFSCRTVPRTCRDTALSQHHRGPCPTWTTTARPPLNMTHHTLHTIHCRSTSANQPANNHNHTSDRLISDCQTTATDALLGTLAALRDQAPAGGNLKFIVLTHTAASRPVDR